jgi:hypothetical protein
LNELLPLALLNELLLLLLREDGLENDVDLELPKLGERRLPPNLDDDRRVEPQEGAELR